MTDRTEFPLASHGTPTGDFPFDEIEIDLERKEFPFMFDPTMQQSWDEEVERIQKFLRNNGIHNATIDEVALLVPDANSAGVYVFDAVLQDGVEHFNAANDKVRVEPFKNEYRVRYDFLRLEGKPYRLEVMHMTDGISPLHASLYQQAWTNNEPVTVHVSFKCTTEASYRVSCALLHDAMEMREAQACESEYGLFSYWRSDISDLYIKPRFNKRDA